MSTAHNVYPILTGSGDPTSVDVAYRDRLGRDIVDTYKTKASTTLDFTITGSTAGVSSYVFPSTDWATLTTIGATLGSKRIYASCKYGFADKQDPTNYYNETLTLTEMTFAGTDSANQFCIFGKTGLPNTQNYVLNFIHQSNGWTVFLYILSTDFKTLSTWALGDQTQGGAEDIDLLQVTLVCE